VTQALLVLAATEGEETSKTAFYLLGGLLAAFAVVIAAIGIARHEHFPPSRGAARGVMGLAALLVVGAMGSAVLTA
jgi:hypothetical protein